MKTLMMNFRVTEEEKQKIEENAKRINLSVSEYLRFLGLNAKVKLKADLEIEIKQ